MKVKLLIGLISLGLVLVATTLGRQVSAAVPEDCQYPQRPLTPQGGCDNSDPCDPTTLKVDGLWGKCRPEMKEISPMNPNRPYYDQYGNQYDYQGNLIYTPGDTNALK